MSTAVKKAEGTAHDVQTKTNTMAMKPMKTSVDSALGSPDDFPQWENLLPCIGCCCVVQSIYVSEQHFSRE
jgi:hypothetical protein